MARPTLIEVAAAAGVSLASASRALSGGTASSRTVAKVRTAAHELGYFPHATARSLRYGAARRVAFAVDDIGNPNYVAMLRAIEASFGPDGPLVSVTSTGGTARNAEVLRQVELGMADGLIISPIRVDYRLRKAIESSPMPVVVIGNVGEKPAVDSVHVDSSRGIEMAVRHLHAIGRRNITFLNGPVDTNPGSSRERGFYRAVRALKIPDHRQRQIVADDFTVAAGRAAAETLFRDWHQLRPIQHCDAIVAANDLIAIGAITAAVDAGLSVPHDVAVTGIDDTDIAAAYNPSLTSVSLHAGRRGAIAAELLTHRFDEPNRPIQVIEVEPQLVVRGSTTAPESEAQTS